MQCKVFLTCFSVKGKLKGCFRINLWKSPTGTRSDRKQGNFDMNILLSLWSKLGYVTAIVSQNEVYSFVKFFLGIF